MNQSLAYRLNKYYNSPRMRTMINIIYIICQIFLSIYLLFIPIQIAYYWLLAEASGKYLQDVLDGSALVFFTIHILLYLDEKMFEWLKSPYSQWHQKILTLEFFYDVFCLLLSIYGVVVSDASIVQRIIQLVFFFKIYKLIKFDLKCMYIVIGTWFYMFYKIFRTLLIMFMAISYVGALFYGIAYYLYKIPIQNTFLLWIVSTGAIDQCVQQPFLIQLEYAMYWALATASTAAYGDISAAQPVVVLINLLALAFEGFLFGFYLNSMHSIPIQRKQKQADLLQKFDAFQQHCSNRKIDQKLYLQIICSLEYVQNKKKNMDSIQRLLPRKYLKQIKSSIYNSFICDPTIFGSEELQLEISEKITQNVCQMGQDIYNYKGITKDSLLFIKQGIVETSLHGQLKLVSTSTITKGYYIGLYQFLTGLLIPQNAKCMNYCFLYQIKREDYKSLLPQYMRVELNRLQLRAFLYNGQYLEREPLVKFIKNLQDNNADFLFFNFDKKSKIIRSRYYNSYNSRGQFDRYGQKKIKKILPKKQQKKSIGVQTQNYKQIHIEKVYHWDQDRSTRNTKLLYKQKKIQDQIQLKQISFI